MPKEKKSKRKMPKCVSDNYWRTATIVLAIAIIVGAISLMPSGEISAQQAGDLIIDYLNENSASQIDAEITSVEESGSVYEVTVIIDDQPLIVYVTKDGKNFVPPGYLVPLKTTATAKATQETPTEIPTTETPEAALYIWSYCPHGVTALGPFAEVAKLLGNSANFKVYLYYAGHGDFEVQQNKIQACIQDLGYEQYWDYAETFANEIYEKCYGDAICDLEESTALMNTLGIDSSAVLECVSSRGESLTSADYEAAADAGVSGSPTLLVNGAKASVSRTAEAFKTAICSGYTDAPNRCEETLSTSGTTATGNC